MSEDRIRNLTPAEQRLQEEIRGLGGVRPAAEFRARLRADFVAGTIASPVSTPEVVRFPRRRLAWAAVPAALAAALAFVLLTGGGPTWTLRAVSGSGAVVVDGRSLDVGDVGSLRKAIKPGSHITVGPSAVLDVVLGDVAVLGLAAGTEAVLPAHSDASGVPLTVDVVDGDVAVSTGPGFPGRRLVLTTGEGRTEITGTTVGVFKCEDLTCVCVMEGTARIGRDAAHMDAVAGGKRKVMFADGADPLIDAIEPGHAHALEVFVARNQDAFN